jgi:hypothetical protein
MFDQNECRRVVRLMPKIKFPVDFSVTILPPFYGAVVRMRVNRDDVEEDISVYGDFYENIGYFGQPYWEIYPYPVANLSGELSCDTFRCAIADVGKLIEALNTSFDWLRKSENERAAQTGEK